MTEIDHTPGPIDALIADWRISRKRLKENPPTTIEGIVEELRNNIYPSLIALAEEAIEIDEVVLEMSEQGGSFIQPELAAQIFSMIAIGAQLVEEARNFLPEMSDVVQKRVKELLDRFEQATELTLMGVTAAAADPVEDEDEDEEDKEDKEEPTNIPLEFPDAAETEGDQNV